jgi:hypothetical protein
MQHNWAVTDTLSWNCGIVPFFGKEEGQACPPTFDHSNVEDSPAVGYFEGELLCSAVRKWNGQPKTTMTHATRSG